MSLDFRESRHVPALVGLCLLLFVVALGTRDIWDIDEGMHAAIAQTMLSSGDWVTPVFNGEPFFDKPVLFNWLNAIAFAVFGITEFAARLPAALAGLGCVLLTYLIGRRIFDARTGFLAAIILATSLELIAMASTVQYDVPFTFFTTLALYCFLSGLCDERLRRRYYAGFYAATALAVLTKGPIGLLLPAMVIGTWILVTRRWAVVAGMQLPLGIVIFFAIVTPWFAMMEQANPGYLYYFIVKQHLGNFLGGEGLMRSRHPEPFHYYVSILLIGMLPWSLLLPQALWRTFRERDLMTTFLLLWFGTIFLFFSAATSKLATYILPLFPAVALLVARYLRGFVDAPDPAGRRLMLGMFGGLCVVMATFTIYAVTEDPWSYWDFRAGIAWRDVEILLAGLTTLSLVVAACIWAGRYRATVWALAAMSPYIIFFVLFVLVPTADDWRGSRKLGLALDRVLAPGEPFHFHVQLLDSAMFYADRPAVMLDTAEDLEAYLASDERVYVIVRTRSRTAAEAFRGNYHVVEQVGNKAIVSNRPGPLD